MSRPFVCDVCKAKAEPDAYGLAPNGWLTVKLQTTKSYTPAQDICSASCLTQLAATLTVAVSHG